MVKRLRNLSLRIKFLIAFVFVLLPIIFIPITALENINNLTSSFNRVIDEVNEEIVFLFTLEHLADRVIHSLNESMATGDKQSTDKLRSDIKIADEKFKQIKSRPFDEPDERKGLNEVLEVWETSKKNIINVLNGPGINSPEGRTLETRVLAENDIIDSTLQNVKTLSEEELRTELSAVNKKEEILVRNIIYEMGAGLVLIFIVIYFVTGSVLVPVNNLSRGTDRLGKNEFSYRIPVKSADELGALSKSFNEMAAKMEKTYSRLEIETTHDSLTNVYNRKEFYRLLNEEVLRIKRYNRRFSLLMIDIDHFKEINDKYGHQVGDKVLYIASQLMKTEVRPMDQVARVGGDEFIIILPETGCSQAMVLAKRLLDAVALRKVSIDINRSIDLSVSIGVASFPDDADTGEKIVTAADKALYAAKHFGRGSLICYRDAA